MVSEILFPFSEYWSFYVGFSVFVLLLLALDLGVFHRNAHEVSTKEAGAWTAVWISLSLLFSAGLHLYADHKFAGISGGEGVARRLTLEFLTGFTVEKALAVDNIFIFLAVFSYFAIPKLYQHKILFYGIIGALIFRGIFIALGATLMEYQWMIVLFGIFLVVTGIKIMLAPDKAPDPERNPFVRLARRFLPVTASFHGGRFLARENGVRVVTPLFLALLFIEFSDIVFAVDSVPAIFAITKEPFIVFTSNIFAILGLRSMFFLLQGVLHRFCYLKYGLGAVLVFVGLKMAWLNELFGGKFPIGVSLGIICTLIGGAVLASFLFPPKQTTLIATKPPAT